MKTTCVFLILAVTGALAMQVRNKRQSNRPDDTNTNDLEDRYGPWQNQQNGNRFPGQGQFNQFPGQNNGRFPGQNNGQGQLPGRFPGQNNGQGQFPGQNNGRFPGQNNGQGQFPGWFPGQNNGQGQFPGQNNGQGQLPGWFPDQNNGQGQLPGQGGNNQQPTTTANPNAATVQACIRNCPVTAEYNPVCGTDGTTYTNPGRLGCAQNCGVNVSLSRSAPCPAATTTAAPNV